MNSSSHHHIDLLKIILIVAAVAVLLIWLLETPPGLLGKADAIGYAVCHRIPSHSFALGDRPLPLCARCSGMYLGALVGLLVQSRLGRRGGMPPLKIMWVLAGFLVAFGIDGVNSYAHFIPGFPTLYTPMNWLRLLTGSLMGLGMAVILLPVFNETLWADWDPSPLVSSIGRLGGMVLIALGVDAAVLLDNPLLLYPLALISAATVWVLLGMIHTIIWVLITKRENHYHTLGGMWKPLLAGFTTALLQIALMDLGRLLLTHTWAGFNL